MQVSSLPAHSTCYCSANPFALLPLCTHCQPSRLNTDTYICTRTAYSISMQILLQHIALSCALSVLAIAWRRSFNFSHTGSDSGIHMHRHSITQAHTHTQALTRTARLSPALSLSLLRNTFRARLRSQRAQLNEPRPQRTVSLQSVVGQSTRTQLALLSHKRNQIEGAQSEKILKNHKLFYYFFFCWCNIRKSVLKGNYRLDTTQRGIRRGTLC